MKKNKRQSYLPAYPLQEVYDLMKKNKDDLTIRQWFDEVWKKRELPFLGFLNTKEEQHWKLIEMLKCVLTDKPYFFSAMGKTFPISLLKEDGAELKKFIESHIDYWQSRAQGRACKSLEKWQLIISITSCLLPQCRKEKVRNVKICMR